MKRNEKEFEATMNGRVVTVKIVKNTYTARFQGGVVAGGNILYGTPWETK